MREIIIGLGSIVSYAEKIASDEGYNLIRISDYSENKIRQLYKLSSLQPLNKRPILFLFEKFKKNSLLYSFLQITTHNIIIDSSSYIRLPNFKTTDYRNERYYMDNLIKGEVVNMDKLNLQQLLSPLTHNWMSLPNGKEILNILLIINQHLPRQISKRNMLYVCDERWLKYYLLFSIPKTTKKIWWKTPIKQINKHRDEIIRKIAKHFNYSFIECKKSWWLLRKIIDEEIGKIIQLTKDEMRLLGIKSSSFIDFPRATFPGEEDKIHNKKYNDKRYSNTTIKNNIPKNINLLSI